MGGGKTSAAINYMNNAPKKTKFIFCTPYLSEVERVIEGCKEKEFVQPEVDYENSTKLESVKGLMQEGKNIVTTHALLKSFDRDANYIVRQEGYTLILDETLDVINVKKLKSVDLKVLTDSLDSGQNYGKINTYGGLLFNHRLNQKSFNGCLYLSNSKLAEMFPIEIFESFKQVIILTYMYHNSLMRYYFDYFDVQTGRLFVKGNSVENYTLTSEYQQDKKIDFSHLINIIEHEKLNEIGRHDRTLTKAWYEKQKDFSSLRKNTYNFFRNICKAKACNGMWTTFVDFKTKVKGKGYTKGFVPCSTRGLNEFRDKDCLAYLVNRYVNPNIKVFFAGRGATIDEDGFALNEMLQWIWRSAIRDGKPITIYIPSKRMRNLLVGWLNSNKKEAD